MTGTWDNGGEPVEFDHDGDTYRVCGEVSIDGDAKIKKLHVLGDGPDAWYVISVIYDPAIRAAACDALEQAWWDQLDWREQRRWKNREGV